MSSSEHTKESSSRLTNDETTAIFRSMANSKVLRERNALAYKLFGQGVWLLQAKSAPLLKRTDPSKAIYVPMGSLSMFFTNQALMQEKINPSKEMLVAFVYVVPNEGTLAYMWTKAFVKEENTDTQSVSTPRANIPINIPPVVTTNGKKPPMTSRNGKGIYLNSTRKHPKG